MAVVLFPVHRVRPLRTAPRAPWIGATAAVGAATFHLAAALLNDAVSPAHVASAMAIAAVLLAIDARLTSSPMHWLAVAALTGAAALTAARVDAMPLTMAGVLALGVGGAFSSHRGRDLLDEGENEPVVLPDRSEPIELPRAA